MSAKMRVVRTPAGWRLRGRGSEGANRFLERIEVRGLAEGSTRTYAFDVLNILRWLKRRGLKPEAVKEEDLYRFLTDHRGGLKPGTLNRQLRLLHRWAGGPAWGPARVVGGRRWPEHRLSLPYVKEPKTIRQPLSDPQVRRMLQGFRTQRDRAIGGLMWALGLRIGEVLALHLEDIDWAHQTLRIHGKGRRERSLPLVERVGGLLRRYLDLERPRQAGSAVFVVLKGPRRGQPLTYAGIRRLFRYYRQRWGIPEAHPHRFRHTFAANMTRQGVSMPTLMRLMGHTWIHTTLRYIHFDDTELREHYEKAMAHEAVESAGCQRDPIL